MSYTGLLACITSAHGPQFFNLYFRSLASSNSFCCKRQKIEDKFEGANNDNGNNRIRIIGKQRNYVKQQSSPAISQTTTTTTTTAVTATSTTTTTSATTTIATPKQQLQKHQQRYSSKNSKMNLLDIFNKTMFYMFATLYSTRGKFDKPDFFSQRSECIFFFLMRYRLFS